MKAKKHFGQNFLKDDKVLDAISNAVNATSDDLIIEIGPGRGALTKKLIKKNSNILAYEIDTDMNSVLSNLESDKFKVIYGDFLKSNILDDIKKIKYNKLYFVGNLPYYITTPIIEYITSTNIKYESLTVMVQREVADRFLALPGTKEYGYFTVYLNFFYNISKVINVSKEAFVPAPKVNSAVVHFEPKDIIEIDQEKYFKFLKSCFKEKRKKLKNNLRDYNFDEIIPILNKHNISEDVRPEGVPGEVFIDIYNYVNK